MAISFVTFLERVSHTRVKLRVVMWHDTFELFVDKNRTQRINFKDYSTEEWNEIDFESLNERVCWIDAYKGHDTAFVFGIPRQEIVNDIMSQYIKQNYPGASEFRSIFMERELSGEWLRICKQYDPNLEKVITEATAKKLGINIPKTDVMIDRINALIDSYVDDSWTVGHLKDEIADILRGVKPDEEIQTCNDGIKTDKVVTEN